MDAKAKFRAGTSGGKVPGLSAKPTSLSDRETKTLDAEVETHERRIDEAVFALYGVDGLQQ